MSFFLYKPHIHGPEGITTPDVIIDQVDGDWPGPASLTSETYLSFSERLEVSPGFALVALGGGTILAPAIKLAGGVTVLSRHAWRLRDLKVGALRLAWGESGIGLAEGSEMQLEEVRTRGLAVFEFFHEGKVEVERPASLPLTPASLPLTMECAGAQMRLTLHLNHADRRPFAPGTEPRYSVGPQHGAIKHYI